MSLIGCPQIGAISKDLPQYAICLGKIHTLNTPSYGHKQDKPSRIAKTPPLISDIPSPPRPSQVGDINVKQTERPHNACPTNRNMTCACDVAPRIRAMPSRGRRKIVSQDVACGTCVRHHPVNHLQAHSEREQTKAGKRSQPFNRMWGTTSASSQNSPKTSDGFRGRCRAHAAP